MTLLAHERHEAALAYIEREAERDADPILRVREPERKPLGGLTLDQYRMARTVLARNGRIKQVRGRWVPA